MNALNLSHLQKSSIVKALSIILLQTILLSNSGIATINLDRPARPRREETPPADIISTEKITIPKNIGTVGEKYKGTDGKLVIHIQDAHCNYEAQSNIARILERIIKDYGVSLVAVEAANGVVNTEWFKAFPDSEIRKDVADYFMKKGELTGVEYLSITTDYPFTIYGVEDREYYRKNLISFLESYPHKEEFKRFYKNVKSAIARLKKFIYTKELAGLDKTVIQHEEKRIGFGEYVEYLNRLADSKGLGLEEYKNIQLLTKTQKQEKYINFKVVNGEREDLIGELSKKLPKKTLSELVNRASEFRQGNIGTDTFHSYLANLAEESDIPLAEKYNNFRNYLIYLDIYGKIDNKKLFGELDLLVKTLKEKMFVNNDQRILDKLWTNVNVILGFAEIELTNKEYEYYLANRDEFTPDKFAEFIRQKSSDFGLAYNMENTPQELETIFSNLVSFYEIGLKRDKILVKNMFDGMRGKEANIAVLVAGGFHTKGINKLLEKEGVSYVVVSPVITKDAENQYISVLTSQKAPFEELLAKTVKTTELSTP